METPRLFSRSNYLLFVLSLLIVAIGLCLMSGPGSTSTHFEPDIFSVRRIVVAPIVCLAGYLLVFVAILWRRK
ncbi:MAG: DUF3098 domain-containing protein [Bacteroidaceae bacterium]|nr:DUF3098 domain-containing protein [Bacteroidaceae bacterium]